MIGATSLSLEWWGDSDFGLKAWCFGPPNNAKALIFDQENTNVAILQTFGENLTS